VIVVVQDTTINTRRLVPTGCFRALGSTVEHARMERSILCASAQAVPTHKLPLLAPNGLPLILTSQLGSGVSWGP
jgi:hypothetical protein